MAHLSRPQAWVLEIWSMDIVLVQRVGLTMVAIMKATVLDRSVTAMRGCLRDWYLDGADKQSAKGRTLDVHPYFTPHGATRRSRSLDGTPTSGSIAKARCATVRRLSTIVAKGETE